MVILIVKNNMTYFSLAIVIDCRNWLWEKKEIDANFQKWWLFIQSPIHCVGMVFNLE